MKILKLCVLLIGVGLVTTSCAVTDEDMMAEGWFPMKGEQIKAAFNGNTLSSEGLIVFHPNVDELKGKKTLEGKIDVGAWRVMEDQYCVKWAEWNGGAEKCSTLRRRGNEIRWYGGEMSLVSNGNGGGL